MRNKDARDIENTLRVPKTHFGTPFRSLKSSNDLTGRKGGRGLFCLSYFTVYAH